MSAERYMCDPPVLRWDANMPSSAAFEDIYNPPDNTVEWARQTFLSNNQLPDRWRNAAHFTIGELGFGTALNFLITADAWRCTAPPTALLHYVAFEKYPLSRDEVDRATCALVPGNVQQALIAQYPDRLAGVHRIVFPLHRIALTLHFNDALAALQTSRFAADAWYMDGFAPARNPELWSADVCHQLAQHSRCGTTLATYTAAGAVRRNLIEAGFVVYKTPGAGAKRESLTAVLEREPTPGAAFPEFRRPESAAIIGGGIAGASAAFALAWRGVPVTLIERQPGLAMTTSGVPLGLVHSHVTAKPTSKSRFLLTALQFSLQQLENLQNGYVDERLFERCGVIQFPTINRVRKLMDAGASIDLPSHLIQKIDAPDVEAMCGYPAASDALYYKQAARLSPAALCRAYVNAANIHGSNAIDLQFNTDAVQLARSGDRWIVRSTDNAVVAKAEVVIVANSLAANQFPQLSNLIMRAVKGQVASLRGPAEQRAADCAVCGMGYFTAALQPGAYVLGGGYSVDDESCETAPTEIYDLATELQQWLPTFSLNDFVVERISVGHRAATFDTMPFIGAIENVDGLYVSCGHGSHGLLAAPIGAELLASMICNEPHPLSAELAHAISPRRMHRK